MCNNSQINGMMPADDSAGHKEATNDYIKKLRTKMAGERGVEQQQGRGKVVVFDTVHVRQHERIALTNEGGPALGLGWDFFDHPRATPIEVYERSRPPPQTNFRIRSRLSVIQRLRLLTKYYVSRDGLNVEKPKKKDDLIVHFEGLDIVQESRSENRPTLFRDHLLSDGDEDSLSLDALGDDELIVGFGDTGKQDASTFQDAKSTLFSSASSLFDSLGEEKVIPKGLEIMPDLIPTQERLHLRQRKRRIKRQVVAKGA